MQKKLRVLFGIFIIFSALILPTFIYAASASLQYLSYSTTITIGGEVFFRVTPTGFVGNINYTVTDSLSPSTISNSNIDSNGTFVWRPTSADTGIHNITVYLSDSSGNSTSVSQQVKVPTIPTVAISNVVPGTSVNVGQTVFFSTTYTGLTNPTFTVSDSGGTSSITYANLNSSGGFSWTPIAWDVGSHSITVTASDEPGHGASATLGITVGIATSTISAITPGTTIIAKQPVSFKVTSTGFTNPTYTISDSFYGNNINNSNLDSTGLFTWTPNINDIGTHLITIKTNDSTGNTASISQEIFVTKPFISLSGSSANVVTNVGKLVSTNATTTGFQSPYYTISDNFSGTSVKAININQQGIFTWTPLPTDLGNHNIRIMATDSIGNSGTTDLNVLVTNEIISNISQATNSNAQLSTNKYTFTKAISFGSKGTEVTELQKKLTALGIYSGPVTGTFGALTRTAVKKLQAKYKLEQIGSVGPATRKILNTTI